MTALCPGRVLALVCCCTLAAACSAYNDELLQLTGRPPGPISGRPGGAGAGGVAGTPMAGRAGGSGAGSGGAGGMPMAGTGGDVMVVGCGDGRVNLTEKCDIGIAAGQPGACPSECPTLANCIPRSLSGSSCQAECVELMQVCMDGDGCCPSRCSNETDADCSASCGDGEVQEDEGETCEPDAPSDEPACKTQEDCEAEDDDPCTVDRLMGNAENCNATCTHEMITALTGGDQCCLPEANANSDSDCEPECGNDVREGDEECDGSDGCDDACKVTRTPEQQACIDKHVDGADDACGMCTCTVCTALAASCRDSDNESRNMHCEIVSECANERDCASDVCYCGTAPDVIACALFADGPCKSEIEAAAGTTDPRTISLQGDDPDTALGRADRLGACILQNCDAQCRGGGD